MEVSIGNCLNAPLSEITATIENSLDGEYQYSYRI